MQFLSIILSVLVIVAMIASVVFWVMAIYGAFTRTDLKENKWLWIAMLLFFGPIGVIAYFFVENKKRLGIFSLVAILIIFLGLPGFAIASFVSRSIMESKNESSLNQADSLNAYSKNLELQQSK